MATPIKGSAAAAECGIALAQVYNHIRAGRVTNHLKGGWPEGKGVEVDLDELKAAIASTARAPRKPKGERSASGTGRVSRKDRKALEADMHEALDTESEEKRAQRAARRAHDDGGNTVRLVRRDRGSKYPVCPVNPAHGEVAPAERDAKAKPNAPKKFQCWHQEHDGRPKGHPGGFAPATQFVFTEEELQTPQPIGPLGVIMLGWIMSGQPDLSDSLESWMTKNKLPVWIPARSR